LDSPHPQLVVLAQQEHRVSYLRCWVKVHHTCTRP
jgi:hypothetical protein